MKAFSSRDNQSGMALIVTLMVLLLSSALMVAFFAAISADQRANGIDRDQTQAYAAAHAGLEKLTTDLAKQFDSDFSPSTRVTGTGGLRVMVISEPSAMRATIGAPQAARG